MVTLGCKSNQYDSAALAADLEKAGLVRSDPENAHVIVINTCMVTGPTEAQCRKAIRQARRCGPGARIVVAGCMSKGARREIEAMEEVDLILDPDQKGNLIALLEPGLHAGTTTGWVDWPEEAAVEMGDRDRGFLKVQDGCDASCTYCIVPSVRGRSRSLDPLRVFSALETLVENGIREIVLSGIHLGQYGRSSHGQWSLEGLLEGYLKLGLPGRLRLSSLEPLEITDRLIAIVGESEGRICRHFHIPLQSGSDRVLAAMNRPYNREQFADTVERIRDAIPAAGIGCDVICGFPGETEEDFQETLDLVDGLALTFIHAFPYSPRPSTVAAGMKDDVPHQVKKERAAFLTARVYRNRIAFAEGFVGTDMVLALENRRDDRGRVLALADNYLRVAVDTGGMHLPGTLVEAAVTGMEIDHLEAVVRPG